MLEIHRSGFYFKPAPMYEEDLRIMRLMGELHMEDPCRGTRGLVDELLEKGVEIGRDKVRRLMQAMRIKAVYCVPRTTVADKTKYKFPYLLRDLKIERRNQVWAVDITYLPIRGGFMYMVAVIDLYSRYVLNWSISNSMDASWVTAMITEAIALHGKPEILNRAIDPIARAASSPVSNIRPCSAKEVWPKAPGSAWTASVFVPARREVVRSITCSLSASGGHLNTNTST